MAFSDRRDAKAVRGEDAFHKLLIHMYPRRCDSLAFFAESVDMTAVKDYIKRRNEEHPDTHITIFHIFLAAMMHVAVKYPRLNRFIKRRRMYQRDHAEMAFVVKKRMAEDGEEGFVKAKFTGEDTLSTLAAFITKMINDVRADKDEDAQGTMNILGKLPNFLLHFIVSVLSLTDNFKGMPRSLDALDPNQVGIFIANLAALDLDAPFHHLNEWGTTSVFVTIGKMKPMPVVNPDNNAIEVRDVVNLAFTLDERVADGFYFAQCLKLFRHLMKHPDLLERPAKEVFEF